MEINQLLKEVSKYLASVTRYSCYAQSYKKNNITSVELKFHKLNELQDLLNNNWTIFKDLTCQNKDLKEYPYGDCKTSIEYRSIDHESIKQKILQLINSVNTPNVEYNFETTKLKFQCYIIKTTDKNGVNAYFITKKSPIHLLKKHTSFQFISDGTYVSCDKPILNLSTVIDAIIFKNNIYFASLKLEPLLGLETYAKKQKEACLTELSETLSSGEFNEIKGTLSKKNSRSYKNYSTEHIDNLKNPEKKKKIATKLQIPQDQTGAFNLSDENAKERFTLYILNKIAMDIDNDDQNLTSSVPLEKI